MASDPIRLPGNAYKGVLHYRATFIPALALNGVSFDKRDTTDTTTKMVNETASISSSNHSAPVPLTIKPSTPSLNPPAAATPSPVNSSPRSSSPTPEASNTEQDAAPKEEQQPKGVDMTVDELLMQRA